ncbi:hypothetical protein IQ243_07000 [Nostocales cyanobacterium LEGE 11386]|nr:hypothetical protein [Nostocales cyanobacterium LEGE 11386]
MISGVQNKKHVNQDFLDNIILLPIDLALLFCATFSGQNKILYDFPLFFVFWIIIFFLRRNLLLSSAEFLAQILIFLALLPIYIQFYKYNSDYYFGSIAIILYVNVLVFATQVIERLLSDSQSCKIVRWLPGISLIFMGILTQYFAGNDPRQSFIFGPNIYYRIIGSLFLLNLALVNETYSGRKQKTSIPSLIVTIICLITALFIMLRTGSRGAIIIGIVMIFSFGYTVISMRLKWLKFATIALIFSLFAWLIQSSFSEYIFDSRAFWFYDRGVSSSSISTRQGFLQNLPSFFINDNYLLGEGSDYVYSYPHNIYLDLLYNGGFYPCLMLLVFTIFYIILLWQGKLNRTCKVLTLVCLPIYIGSLFSGTSYNNYSVISLIFMLPFWRKK